jgi:hypothetical protein
VQSKIKNHQLSKPQGEYEQIKYLIPIVVNNILDNEREEHT